MSQQPHSRQEVIPRTPELQQVKTRPVTTFWIMSQPPFARGLKEVRSGKPLDWRACSSDWSYERGRAFGCIAPVDLPLFVRGKQLNPKAVALFNAASDRGCIL